MFLFIIQKDIFSRFSFFYIDILLKALTYSHLFFQKKNKKKSHLCSLRNFLSQWIVGVSTYQHVPVEHTRERRWFARCLSDAKSDFDV